MFRSGIGFDLHPLVSGRDLILGGVKIPYPKGLAGHSDGDVLVHALMDALLGAAGLPDIGHHFPPGDRRYRDACSLDLLARVRLLVKERELTVVNCDAVVVTEQPRLAPHVQAMAANIAAVLELSPAGVSIKATTTEGLGVCGRGQAIAAQAVVLLRKMNRCSSPCGD